MMVSVSSDGRLSSPERSALNVATRRWRQHVLPLNLIALTLELQPAALEYPAPARRRHRDRRRLLSTQPISYNSEDDSHE